MPVQITDVLMGPVEIYVGDFGAVEPTDAEAVPGVAFTAVGGTQEGARQIVGQTITPKVVDEIGMPVGGKMTEQTVAIATSLAEARLSNFRLAYNQAVSAATKLGINGNLTNGEPPYVSVLLRGFGPGGDRRLVILRRALSTEPVETAYSKANQTYIPIQWSGYYISESVDAMVIDDTQAA